jgi:uncharacterized membrane protein
MAQVFHRYIQTEHMRSLMMYACCFLLACGNGPNEEPVGAAAGVQTSTPARADTPIAASDTITNEAAEGDAKEELPVAPLTKRPSGIYQLLLPLEGDEKMLQTVAFYPTTYRLQEEYGKRDSTVVTEGTWASSEGTIWLYKDHILRGRYTWKGDTLQYYSPRLKRSFSTEKLTPALANKVWQTKRKEGALLYGVGTEPFWSVEVTGRDSIVLNMPDWAEPFRAKLTSSDAGSDSIVYAAGPDSLYVALYPYFCSDGMSDFVYTRKVKVMHRNKTYEGCGELLRQNH